MTRPFYSIGFSETYNIILSFCMCVLLCGIHWNYGLVSWYVCLISFSSLWVTLSGRVNIDYLQVNALGEWIIGIYCTSSLTMNEIFQYRTRPPSVVLKNFEFIVSERVQVNPDDSRAMSALTFFIIQIKYTASKNHQILSQPKPWCNDSGV